MQICCTKKLQDELGINVQNVSEENDLFCWSAHLITANRRKAIVVVNDSNRIGFVLYGLKAKDFKNLNELLFQGIISCLFDEKIKEEIIEQYLKASGELIFTKTRGAKYVARINKACELVKIFEDKLDPSIIFQTIVTRIMNHDLVKIYNKSDYEYAYELLSKDLKQFWGEDIIKCEAVDLMVKLDLGRKKAWRRIITPVDITFKQLHKILQVAFDWKDYHQYDFNIFDSTGKYITNVINKDEDAYEPRQDSKMLLDSETWLSEYAKEQYRIIYCYDFGDSWKHEIIIEAINIDYNKNYPTCLLGEGNAPPEDVGGIPGYEEFLKIIANPHHKEYEHIRQWAQNQWYKDFDVDLINLRLKNIL